MSLLTIEVTNAKKLYLRRRYKARYVCGTMTGKWLIGDSPVTAAERVLRHIRSVALHPGSRGPKAKERAWLSGLVSPEKPSQGGKT